MELSIGDDRQQHQPFVYIHVQRFFRRHILQLNAGNRRVILHSGLEYQSSTSGWHGEHNMESLARGFVVRMHYAGDDADIWRRLVVLNDIVPGCYVAYHCNRPWAYMLHVGLVSEEAASAMIADRLLPNPGPPPPPEQWGERLRRAELGFC